MLSIIVLSYNRLAYTKQTVQNLIDVTTVKHEFIFSDNGSIDGTREYLESLKKKTNATKITYVFNDRNFGVAGGRNSGLKVASGDYLMLIDDDILVPQNYDKHFIEACDKIPRLGVTGVNVEKRNYPIVSMNGVEVRAKKGNLGGGCLCLSRKVFDKVGYFSPDFVYGGEDRDLYVRLRILKLISAYIVPKGKHIDKRENKQYEAIKRYSHSRKSDAFKKVGNNEIKYKNTKNVYIPYREPTIDTKIFDDAIKHEK